jgi:N-acetylmuramoyl-L-alanine amidase
VPPIVELPSPNHDARPGGVDMLILHYTGMKTAQEAIDRLRDPHAKVSSHYVVGEDGAIYRLVPEDRRAWHAGVSFWRGRTGLNDVSIGIEIVNPGHEWGYRPFPAAQMQSVIALSQAILARHPIPVRNVIAHSDVAPDRKQDPGELFPWPELATAGVGLWPDGNGAKTGPSPWDEAQVRAALGTVGYDATQADLATLLRAFQRHWRPEAVTGLADSGTILRLDRLLRMVAPKA